MFDDMPANSSVDPFRSELGSMGAPSGSVRDSHGMYRFESSAGFSSTPMGTFMELSTEHNKYTCAQTLVGSRVKSCGQGALPACRLHTAEKSLESLRGGGIRSYSVLTKKYMGVIVFSMVRQIYHYERIFTAYLVLVGGLVECADRSL